MDFDTFKRKLKELNPRLYVDENHRTYALNPELGTSGIYLRGEGYEEMKLGGQETPEQVKAIEEYNASPDRYITFITHGYVPEGDIFDFKTGKVIARGWRTTCKGLVRMGLTTAKKAFKVFGWTESDYDRMSYAEKLDFEGHSCPRQ